MTALWFLWPLAWVLMGWRELVLAVRRRRRHEP